MADGEELFGHVNVGGLLIGWRDLYGFPGMSKVFGYMYYGGLWSELATVRRRKQEDGNVSPSSEDSSSLLVCVCARAKRRTTSIGWTGGQRDTTGLPSVQCDRPSSLVCATLGLNSALS